MATAPFGRARSFASCNLLRLPDAQAQPDSRRYRKRIRTILEATRWRLGLLVGLAQLLRATSPDCQMLNTSRAVAATGKRSARFLEATRWRLRFLVGLAQLLRATFSDCQMLSTSRAVAATGKDPHDFGDTGRSVNIRRERSSSDREKIYAPAIGGRHGPERPH
jgi:hypothetical protein